LQVFRAGKIHFGTATGLEEGDRPIANPPNKIRNERSTCSNAIREALNEREVRSPIIAARRAPIPSIEICHGFARKRVFDLFSLHFSASSCRFFASSSG
jgi:hypothetical protein